MSTPEITIYTDGACSGNPGPGGYGIVLSSGKYRKELSGGYRKTTNNRMELLAVIIALENLKFENSNVTIYSDSKYIVDAINKKWIYDWINKGFKKIKNPDLWKKFIPLYKKHKIDFFWVKGHSNSAENNRCDELATIASQNPKNIDSYYEELISESNSESNIEKLF